MRVSIMQLPCRFELLQTDILTSILFCPSFSEQTETPVNCNGRSKKSFRRTRMPSSEMADPRQMPAVCMHIRMRRVGSSCVLLSPMRPASQL